MFNKLFKKNKSLIVLHQETGISGNDARKVAEDMELTLGNKVILVPYGYTLEKINSLWILTESGRTRYESSLHCINELRNQLGADVILVRHGLNISIYDINF